MGEGRETTPHCDWCGRAIRHVPGTGWWAVKGEERGYDPLICEASEDGSHTPAEGREAAPEPTSCDFYNQNGCTLDADHDGPCVAGRPPSPCDLSVDACCDHIGGPCEYRPDGSVVVVCHRHARRTIRDPLAPAIDRGLTGDHRLCSLDPCSECR